MADLIFADSHNMMAYLEKSEDNADFAEIVDFLNASPIRYALTMQCENQQKHQESSISYVATKVKRRKASCDLRKHESKSKDQANAYETDVSQDFKQRRNELAAKLGQGEKSNESCGMDVTVSYWANEEKVSNSYVSGLDCTTSSYSLLTLDSTKHNEGQSQALCNCCGEIVSVLFALECLNDFEHTVQASDRQCQMVSLKNNTSGPVLNVKRLLIHYRSALVIMENELLFTSVQASVLHQILLIITAFRTFDSNHNNEQSSSKTGFPKLFLKQTRQLTSRQAFEYKPPSDSNAEATGK
ncbi:hypothetical protein Tco_0318379 [Tanacetum coccineum]